MDNNKLTNLTNRALKSSDDFTRMKKQLINGDESKDSLCNHNQMNKKLGYVAWQEWAGRKIKQGHIQRECPKCGKYLFKCEL